MKPITLRTLNIILLALIGIALFLGAFYLLKEYGSYFVTTKSGKAFLLGTGSYLLLMRVQPIVRLFFNDEKNRLKNALGLLSHTLFLSLIALIAGGIVGYYLCEEGFLSLSRTNTILLTSLTGLVAGAIVSFTLVFIRGPLKKKESF